jgi:hypothetical protein
MPIRAASPILPHLIERMQDSADKGSSRYNEPNQVIVKKKESMGLLWIIRAITN